MRLIKIVWSALIGGGLLMAGCQRAANPQSSLDKTPEIIREDETRKVTCSKDSRSQVLEAAGDTLTKSVQSFTIPYDQLAIPENLPKDEAKKRAVDAINQVYGGIGAVTVAGFPQENEIRVEVTIDYAAANLEQLVKHNLLSEAEVQNRYVSLQKTQDALESAGYACSAQGE